jgi:hypothetical protein
MRERLAAAETAELLVRERPPALVHDGGGVALELPRCSLQRRSRVSRARPGSWQTTFISVSLKSECSLRLAEPTVSHRSSTMPTLAWT